MPPLESEYYGGLLGDIQDLIRCVVGGVGQEAEPADASAAEHRGCNALAWHRRLVAEKYDGSKQRRLGRPRVLEEIQRLVIRMATENRDWGPRRIQGALANLGYEVARGTIVNILKEHGLEPAPERERKTTWKSFGAGIGR